MSNYNNNNNCMKIDSQSQELPNSFKRMQSINGEILTVHNLELTKFINDNPEIFCENCEFKSNYGATAGSTASPGPQTPSTLYCLHGQQQVELRGHCHKQRLEGVDLKARKKLIIASVLCVIFMVAEIVGGILSNSLAIATDAAHLLTDFASFMISLFAIWIAGRPSTQRMSFGWYRAEVIGAMASVVMIWVITAILVWLAIQRVITHDYEVNAVIMLITSGLAILVNLIMGFQLHGGHGHSHGGGGSHSKKSTTQTQDKSTAKPITNNGTFLNTLEESSTQQHFNSNPVDTKSIDSNPDDNITSIEQSTTTTTTAPPPTNQNVNIPTNSTNHYQNSSDNFTVAIPSESSQQHQHQHHHHDHGENMNVRAAFIHVLGDVVQSIGVFLAALLIYFKPEWAIADPICTFVFSIIVLCTTFSIMKDALMVLMEGTPNYLDYTEVMDIFKQIDGVERVHNLRIWALTISKNALSVHLAIQPGANPKKILQEANTAVHRKYNFFETTIQIEDLTPDMDNCQQCILPDP